MRNEKKKSLRDQSNWSEYGWREDSLIVHVCVSTCNVVYRKLIYWSDILCCVYIFLLSAGVDEEFERLPCGRDFFFGEWK